MSIGWESISALDRCRRLAPRRLKVETVEFTADWPIRPSDNRQDLTQPDCAGGEDERHAQGACAARARPGFQPTTTACPAEGASRSRLSALRGQ